MATKEQERKALEQIRKIVDGLGADSYIATAFDGCFQDAEENIENDFALCMKDRYLTESKKAKDLRAEVDRLKARVSELEEELKEQKISTDAEHKFLLAERGKRSDQGEKIRSLEAMLHDRDMTVMELKAKLYDMMMEKEGK